ncbi:MAG: response regulator transcription factor [Candidatus Promineifilaceae bacterium]|nr:response regulator transcription factor [Candidatus Promineifilaceae bacterium]
MNPETIRLLVADDHALFREGLQALFSATAGIVIVGEAATGEAAVALAEELQPDIVLMDINMPEVNGIEATRQILRINPTIGVIMVTMLEDDVSLFSAMRAGARGYILKGARHTELLQAIRAVAGGQALFGAAIATRIMGFFQDIAAYEAATLPQGAFPELTPRELEVLELIAQGANNSQIAEQLVISDKTVRNHITSIFSKLRVADRAQAIIKAREAGLDGSH